MLAIAALPPKPWRIGAPSGTLRTQVCAQIGGRQLWRHYEHSKRMPWHSWYEAATGWGEEGSAILRKTVRVHFVFLGEIERLRGECEQPWFAKGTKG